MMETARPGSSGLRATRPSITTEADDRSGVALGRPRRHRITRVLPRREAAVHLDDGFEPHLLSDVSRERRPPGAVAIEDELLARAEDLLVIRAVGVDPELEHAARTVIGAGNHPLPIQLAHV